MTSQSPTKKPHKSVTVKVLMLDNEILYFQINSRTIGHEFYTEVVKKINLLEADYFDLEYVGKNNSMCWLDHEKSLQKQCPSLKDMQFFFTVKFYSPHPNLLEDEFTRYLFALQIKRDLSSGLLQCNENTSALLAAFIVQAELGDFNEDDFPDYKYLGSFRLVKHTTDEFLMKVMEFHKTLYGQSPAESDYNLLDTARKVELYGIRLHPAKDHENLALSLAVTHTGILVFQYLSRINTFSWAKIRKLSFKRKKFLVKLHPEGFVYYKDTVEFFFETRNDCKSFWKLCIEHHAFFRCQAVKKCPKKGFVVSKGSSYRYMGRTQKQLLDYVREHNYIKRPQFERSASTGRVTSKSPCSLGRHTTTGVVAPVVNSNSQPPTNYPPVSTAGDLSGAGRMRVTSPMNNNVAVNHSSKSVGDNSSTAEISNRSSRPSGFYNTLNSSASARSRNASTSSGSHTMNSSREHLASTNLSEPGRPSAMAHVHPNGRAVSQSPPNMADEAGSRIVSRGTRSLPDQSFPDNNNAESHGGHRQPDWVAHHTDCMPANQHSGGVYPTNYYMTENPSYQCTTNDRSSQLPNNLGPTGPAYGNINPIFYSHEQRVLQYQIPPQYPHSQPIYHSQLPPYSRTVDVSNQENAQYHGMNPPGMIVEETVSVSKTFLCGDRSDTLPPNNWQDSATGLHSTLPGSEDHIIPQTAYICGDRGNALSSVPPQPPVRHQDTVLSNPDSKSYQFNAQSRFPPSQTAESSKASANSSIGAPVVERPTTLLPRSAGMEQQETTMVKDPPNKDSRPCYPPPPPPHGGGSAAIASLSESGSVATMSSLGGPGSNLLVGPDRALSVVTHTLTTLSSVSGGSSQSDADESVSVCRDLTDKQINSQSVRDSVTGQIIKHSSRKRSKSPSDRAYYLVKELLMSERTYKKDLEVLCVWLRKAVASGGDTECRMPERLSRAFFALLDPIYDQHVQLLKDLESRHSAWEGRPLSNSGSVVLSEGRPSSMEFVSGGTDLLDPAAAQVSQQKIGDIFLTNLKVLSLYRKYIDQLEGIVADFERHLRSNRSFESGVREFEAQKVCYLPLYCFFLKPYHRLLHYRVILERLLGHYDDTHADLHDCRSCYGQLLDVIQSSRDSYRRSENLIKLLELQRDLFNIQCLPQDQNLPSDDLSRGVQQSLGQLVCPGREFIREGWLQKLSKKGYQQRMFFLFSDQLIYASRTTSPFLQFKVHGQFPLRELIVEESEASHSFTVYLGNRCFLAAAANDWQRDRWLEDMSRAILSTKTSSSSSTSINEKKNSVVTLPTAGLAPLQDLADESQAHKKDAANSKFISSQGERHQIQQRANTSVHVCWHRNVTLSMTDVLRTNEYQISGYLLRKFKNSNGWQKLWVVFTQLCLFFYKSYQDECPLASLPLLGYTVSTPTPEDQIRKDHVFKLHFKNHVYFFRGESLPTYERWFEVLNSATSGSTKARLSTNRYPRS